MKIELLTKAYSVENNMVKSIFLDEDADARFVCQDGIIKGVVYSDRGSNNWKSLEYEYCFRTKKEARDYILNKCNENISFWENIKSLT